MSSGFSGAWADVISVNEVDRLCPEEMIKLRELRDKSEISFDRFCQVFRFEDVQMEDLFDDLDPLPDEQSRFDELREAWQRLQEAFERRTAVGGSCLTLMVGYHDSDLGDCYDDLSGGFFHVDGVYVRSAAGERFKSVIERKTYVEYS